MPVAHGQNRARQDEFIDSIDMCGPIVGIDIVLQTRAVRAESSPLMTVGSLDKTSHLAPPKQCLNLHNQGFSHSLDPKVVGARSLWGDGRALLAPISQSLIPKGLERLGHSVIPRGLFRPSWSERCRPQPLAGSIVAGLRYETDLTDAEWRLIAPLLPAPKRTGRPLSWPLRDVNAIFYVMRGGVAWRLLPSDLPPKSTAYRWFAAWRDGGVFEALNHALLMIDRERSGSPASPSACIIDSQSVETNEAGGPRGYDAGKKIMGRKRHALVDTDGRGLVLHPASVQDRDGIVGNQ